MVDTPDHFIVPIDPEGKEPGELIIKIVRQTEPSVPVDEKRKKGVYVGAPECFKLELACQHINRAFDGQCYLVGSALKRADWRDIDIRFIMEDEAFESLFPDVANLKGTWEFDPRWLLLTTWASAFLNQATGLPVDFQFQPQSWANDQHDGPRNPVGLRYARKRPSVDEKES